jgi:hypothetical protein
LLLDPGPLSTPFACLRPLIAQLHFTNIFLGIAEGAEEARQYTLENPALAQIQRPHNTKTPILGHYGEFWVGLESVRCWSSAPEQCSTRPGPKARPDRRRARRSGCRHATAKVAASRNGLELCSRLFEVTGARDAHLRCARPALAQPAHADPARPGGLQTPGTGRLGAERTSPIPTFYS